jgi:NSS family neurotransmitter:Na+ symporter
MRKIAFMEEVSNKGELVSVMFKIVFFIIRYVAPVAIGIIAVAALFMEGITG